MLEYIGDSCFRECKLGDLKIPVNVRRIGASSFYGNNLKQITFDGSRLGVVGRHAFGANENLEINNIAFPRGTHAS